MKRKDITQIHTMNGTELASQIQTIGEQIKKMKMERYTKPAKNVHEITILKRKYAIMKTVLRQKNQGEMV